MYRFTIKRKSVTRKRSDQINPPRNRFEKCNDKRDLLLNKSIKRIVLKDPLQNAKRSSERNSNVKSTVTYGWTEMNGLEWFKKFSSGTLSMRCV